MVACLIKFIRNARNQSRARELGAQPPVFGLPGKDLQHDEAKPHRARLGYYREGPIGILTTQFDGGLRAWPLEARADRDAGLIWFVTDVRGAKDDEINAEQEIGLVFIDEDSRAYLSITGRASVARDTAKAKEIWKKTDDIWLQGGPDDPNVRVLRIEPVTAELWDGPSSAAVVAFECAMKR